MWVYDKILYIWLTIYYIVGNMQAILQKVNTAQQLLEY
jgi:hypothetical protein